MLDQFDITVISSKFSWFITVINVLLCRFQGLKTNEPHKELAIC